MEPHLTKGMIGIGFKFFPGAILVRTDAVYLYPTEQDMSIFEDAAGAAGGLFGTGLVGAGGKIANAVHRSRWKRFDAPTIMEGDQIRKGIGEPLLQELKDVTRYIALPRSEIKKINRFIQRTNLHHSSGQKYSITPTNPKEVKPLRAVLSRWFGEQAE